MAESAGVEEEPTQVSYKLVPWFSWGEWNFVRKSLFSSCPHSVSAALTRVNTWRSRGCLPCPVEVTAALVEAQQKDPFFRTGLSDECLNSDEMLAMAYCMAIMRLVNGFVEKTRKKNGPSISVSAERIGIPRMLVDIRHECSHRQLPSLALSRHGSTVALDWLKAYYWEPQKKAIPNVKKEINSKLREMALCLNAKETQNDNPLHTKERRVRHSEVLSGRKIFFSHVSEKFCSSTNRGSKRQISNITKSLTRLFTAYPSEVVAVLLEKFQKLSNSLGVFDLDQGPNNSLVDSDYAGSKPSAKFDVWTAIIVRLSKKEPALLLAMIEAIINMIEARRIRKAGERFFPTLQHLAEAHQYNNLSLLIEQLLKGLKATKCSDPMGSNSGVLSASYNKARLLELLSKCLLISPGNKHLMNSAIIFAQIIGKEALVDKLKKLPVLSFDPDPVLHDSGFTDYGSIFQRYEDSLSQAAKQLDYLKLCRSSSPMEVERETRSKTWTLAKSWSSCPIGMLPYSFGPCGVLPINEEANSLRKVYGSTDGGELIQRTTTLGKREPSCDVEELKNACSVKKMKYAEGDAAVVVVKEDLKLDPIRGCLLIGGFWKEVGAEELLNIESDIRILV